MNPTQRRLFNGWVKQALAAYMRGDNAEGDRCMSNARTMTYPVGALIAQCYN